MVDVTTYRHRVTLEALRLSIKDLLQARDLYHLTPLHTVQKRILALMEVPLEIYDTLVT